MANRQPCAHCGEMIANAVARPIHGLNAEQICLLGPLYVCAQCWAGDGFVPDYNRDRGAMHDAQYHGDRFHTGEW